MDIHSLQDKDQGVHGHPFIDWLLWNRLSVSHASLSMSPYSLRFTFLRTQHKHYRHQNMWQWHKQPLTTTDRHCTYDTNPFFLTCTQNFWYLKLVSLSISMKNSWAHPLWHRQLAKYHIQNKGRDRCHYHSSSSAFRGMTITLTCPTGELFYWIGNYQNGE